jgi:Xaa-Pro aminopeptidase
MAATRQKYPTDPAELERRRQATLAAMKKDGVEALIFAAFDRVFAGVARYLLDAQITLYGAQFMFTVEGNYIIGHGFEGRPSLPGFVRYPDLLANYSVPALPSINIFDDRYPIKMAEIIKKHNFKKIGWVGMNYIPAATYKYLTENLPQVEFVDFSDWMAYIKALKSPWEINEIMKTCRLHDDIMSAIPTILRVGRRERDVVHDIRNLAWEMECPEVNVLGGAGVNTSIVSHYMFGHEIIKKNDIFTVMLELPSPTGYWAEVVRMYCLGEPTPEMKQIAKNLREIRDLSVARMVPGAMPGDMQAYTNSLYKERGYFPDARFGTHSHSYDVVDRPIFDPADTMPLAENMYFAVHTTCVNRERMGQICENALLTGDGCRLLSSIPAEIIVIDY